MIGSAEVPGRFPALDGAAASGSAAAGDGAAVGDALARPILDSWGVAPSSCVYEFLLDSAT